MSTPERSCYSCLFFLGIGKWQKLHGYLVILIFMLVLASNEAWVQRGKNGRIDSILDDFDDEDLRFNDYENRLEDSFFKYVARTDDYDRNEVPWESHEPRKPVQVKMSAYLRNVLNVDEPAQLITIETSLRMTWRDPRLTVRIPAYSPTNYVFFRSDVTQHIWFPDVYIDGIQDLRYPAYKVKPAYLRVYNDSMLKYSARVNYDVACPMHFEKYPVDIQRCNVSFESWGHTNHYIMLSWLYEKRKFSKSIALAQFGLDLHFIEEPPSAFGSLGSYSRVTMQLVLTRKITYHLFRTYLPSGLFVIIGWFSLFIPLDHVPGRVTMGMTTLLTLAAMFSAIATTTPRVSYSSKLDIWMVFCVIFVFGTLMEFSLLIFLQKQIFAPKVILPSWKQLLCKPRSSPSTMGSMYRKRRNSLSTERDCHEEMVPTSNNTNGGSQVMVTVSDITANNVTLRKVNSAGLHSLDEMHPMASMSAPAVNALNEPIAANDEEREYIQHLHKAEELRHQEILFKIERYAISLFALFFLVFNAVYWTDLLYSAKFDER